MTIDFNKLVEFNNKHPDKKLLPWNFVYFNLVISEETNDFILQGMFTSDSTKEDVDEIYKEWEEWGLIKVIGEGLKDVSIRDLGLELIGQSNSDNIIEFAEKFKELFPKGIKSGGYPVRSSTSDIADKLRKFFKKHKYSQEQVLEATKRYIDRKGNEGYSFMQTAVYFIEKNGVSNLAAEIDSLGDKIEPSKTVPNLNTML